MSDIDSRVRALEIESATTKQSIQDIKIGIDNHRSDMKELFEGQEQTRMAVVTGINELAKAVPCTSHATKIEELQKKVNGTDIKGMERKVDQHESVIYKFKEGSAEVKGGAKTLDYVYKAVIALMGIVLMILAFKNESNEKQVSEAKPMEKVREESITPNH